MTERSGKSDQAFKTISELAAELDVPQHILRYWETRFPQLKPLQRAGNRRYYRPADVALAHRIHRLLNQEGYTVRGVQQLLAGKSRGEQSTDQAVQQVQPSDAVVPQPSLPVEELKAIRQTLAEALAASA